MNMTFIYLYFKDHIAFKEFGVDKSLLKSNVNYG